MATVLVDGKYLQETADNLTSSDVILDESFNQKTAHQFCSLCPTLNDFSVNQEV